MEGALLLGTGGWMVLGLVILVVFVLVALAVLGKFLRYAGFAGATGLVLILWTALTGLSRPRAKP